MGLCAFLQISCAGNQSSGFVTNTEESTPTPEVTPVPNDDPQEVIEDPVQKDLFAEFTRWKSHYKKNEPYTKVTENRGTGYEDLYGTRNFRVVLHGVYYRGGANNSYHRDNPRDNMNPLPTDGLKNLCEEGFSAAIYYYGTNYSTAPKVVNCGSGAEENTLNYRQKNALTTSNHPAILQMLHDRIKGKLQGPIYGHCWNGWHASGLIAAISLRQFCDWTASEAKAYWRKNTDGNTNGYEKVEAMVINFKPIIALRISAKEQAAICPAKN